MLLSNPCDPSVENSSNFWQCFFFVNLPFYREINFIKKDLMSFSAIYMRNFVCSALRLGGSGVYRRQELPSFNFSSKTFYMTPHIIFCGCFISHFVYKHSVVMVIKEDSLTTPGSGGISSYTEILDFYIDGSYYCYSGLLRENGKFKRTSRLSVWRDQL